MKHYFTSNEDLASELRVIKYEHSSYNFMFNSDLGVFSKDKIDYGSQLLIDTIISNTKEVNSILDVGCGYGFIGITLSKILNTKVDMCDINKRAIHLTEMNIKENKVDCRVVLSNAYESINNSYDLIVTNPPIRAGKKVVLDILLNAKKHLNKEGDLWFVIRKDQGAKSIVKTLEKDYLCQIVVKNKGFYIVNAKTLRNRLTRLQKVW